MYFINFFFVLYNKLFRKKFDHFISYKYDVIREYYGNNCLDIGAGYGHFSQFINDQKLNIKAIDVINKFQYDIDFELFDGKQILLEDEEVNTSIIMFVLHHTDDQIELLKEASRVTRDYIIIGEDVMSSELDRILGNIHLNTSPWSKSNNLFHSTEEWTKIFKNLNLEIVRTVKIPRSTYPIYPVSRNIFVLKKCLTRAKKT